MLDSPPQQCVAGDLLGHCGGGGGGKGKGGATTWLIVIMLMSVLAIREKPLPISVSARWGRLTEEYHMKHAASVLSKRARPFGAGRVLYVTVAAGR